MRCNAIIDRVPQRWVDDTPFLLWEIGMKTVLEHWVDVLYESNDRLVLWLEEIDSRILNFASDTFPLCRNTTIRIGIPNGGTECFTYLDAEGKIVVSRGLVPMRYLPSQGAAITWFNLVRRWLETLGESGSVTPELEHELQPGVFVGHHCQISRHAEFIAPCWIGSGATVGHARIGPHAVIGENALISNRTRIVESYILQDTFVGAHLALEGMVAGKGKLLDFRTGVAVPICDPAFLKTFAA